MRVVLVLMLLAVLGGCDGEPIEPPEPDAGEPLDAAPGPDRAVIDGVSPPEAPALPNPIVEARAPNWDCPPGWTARTTDTSSASCDPSPDPPCTTDQLRVPGGCISRRPCETAAELPPGFALYVASSTEAGDGTRARPFPTLHAALAVALPGAAIFVAEGRYHESIVVTSSVSLFGACAAQTFIEPALGRTALTVLGSATVKDLTVIGGARITGEFARLTLDDSEVIGGGLVAETGAFLRLHQVRVTNELGTGVVVREATGEFSRVEIGASHGLAALIRSSTVTMADTWIAATRTATNAVALYIADGSRLAASRLAFESNAGKAIFATGAGTAATLEDVLVRDSPRGIEVANESVVTLRRAHIEKTSELGAIVTTDGRLSLEDVVLEPRSPLAIDVERGGRLFAARVSLGNTLGGLAILDGAAMYATDLRLATARPEMSLEVAFGIFARGSDVELHRAELELRGGSPLRPAAAIQLIDGAVALVDDIVVRDKAYLLSVSSGSQVHGARLASHDWVAPISFSGRGTRGWLVDLDLPSSSRGLIGVDVEDEATLELSRVSIAGASGAGLRVRHVGTLLVARDVTLDSSPLSIHQGGQARVSRLHGSNFRERGAGAATFGVGSSLSLEDALLFGPGVGLAVLDHATAEGARIEITDASRIGVEIIDGSLELSDLRVSGTIPEACESSPCPSVGLVAGEGSNVDLTRFAITNNGLIGLAVRTTEFRATDGLVARHVLGLSLSEDPAAASELLRSELLRSIKLLANVRNLDHVSMTLPAGVTELPF
ncbi:MAG: hypothetical protein HY791_26170 [Deltaproteobacteria bacterium]|nr:hypothetical protein [Deltaproteobacteria bacterium]